MRILRILLLFAGLAALAACGDSKFRSYNGPEVTQIRVDKGMRRMYLFHGAQVLKVYDIGLGFDPVGHKQFEGDGKTPEGEYFITRHNPRSRYHLSLGISYPSRSDWENAVSQQREPGGDIMIHGIGTGTPNGRRDWTVGCISVTDDQVEEIYAMVRNGTPIIINP